MAYVEQCGGKDIVADEHSHLVVVACVDRSLSAAHSTLVDNVVVNKRCSVKKLQTDSCVLRHCRDFSEILGHQKHQHRAHTLASALPYVLENLLKKPLVMAQRSVEESDEIVNFLNDRLFNKG